MTLKSLMRLSTINCSRKEERFVKYVLTILFSQKFIFNSKSWEKIKISTFDVQDFSE